MPGRTHPTTKYLLAAVAVSFLPTSVVAEDVPAPPPEIAELVESCASCHGEAGVPVQEDAPIIWGQENYYMYVQLRDIQAGRRASELMKPVVEGLDKPTLKALTAYFSSLKWPALGFATPESDFAVAESAEVAGQCAQCHLGAWTGNSRVPRLAGQNVHYLEKTMLDYKYNRRKNAPDLAVLFRDVADDAIGSLARYAAGK